MLAMSVARHCVVVCVTGYALPHDHDVGAVIVGFDREINYHKIQYAQLCINENPVIRLQLSIRLEG